MRIVLINAQRGLPVPLSALSAFARRLVRRLGIRQAGTIAITFIDAGRMRRLNRRFLRHDRPTDVLSFRYNQARGSGLGVRGKGPQPRAHSPEPIVGDILVAPAAARAYATQHGLSYREELARYVAHGLLHWFGHEDRTIIQRQKMRALEDDLLSLTK